MVNWSCFIYENLITKLLTSVEKEMRREKEDEITVGDDAGKVKDLVTWLRNTLGNKVHQVKITKRLSNHPCVVTVEEMGAARHFVRTQFQSMPEEERYKILEPVLEINTSHPIMVKLGDLKTTNPKFAELVAKQVFDNAMVTAGLIDDPRTLLSRMNELLTLALEKH